jgi:sRNA-binding regulator protein Hfq
MSHRDGMSPPQRSKGGPRPPPGPSPEIRRRAEQVAREAGIPPLWAMKVAQGQLSLNDVLQKLALKDRVEALMSRHSLAKSLATQVAMNQTSLEEVLRSRRLDEHLQRYKEHSSLVNAQQDGKPVALFLHGRKVVQGTIRSVDAYEFELVDRNGEVSRIHKLQVKLACAGAELMKIRSAIKKDAKLDRACEPIVKPQDRRSCSDKRLFGYLDGNQRVVATTLEGEVVKGTIEWMGRWEFGMKVDKSAHRIVIFRHALHEIEEG